SFSWDRSLTRNALDSNPSARSLCQEKTRVNKSRGKRRARIRARKQVSEKAGCRAKARRYTTGHAAWGGVAGSCAPPLRAAALRPSSCLWFPYRTSDWEAGGGKRRRSTRWRVRISVQRRRLRCYGILL